MSQTVVQSSLVSGILSNTAYGRIDIQKYYNGVAEATNMIVESQGGLKKRTGFEYIDGMNGEYRLFEFLFNTTDKAVVLIGADIKIWNITLNKFDTFTGLVGDAHMYTLQEANELDFVQSADTMIMTHEKYPPQKLVRYRDNNDNIEWKLEVLELKNIPQYDWQEEKHDAGASRVLKSIEENDEGNILKIRDDITAAINVGVGMLPRVRSYLQEINTTTQQLTTLNQRDETIRDIYHYPSGIADAQIFRSEWTGIYSSPVGYIGKVNEDVGGYDYLPGDPAFRIEGKDTNGDPLYEDPSKFYIIPRTIETGENQQRWATQINSITVDSNNKPLGYPWVIHANDSYNTVWDKTLTETINEAVRNTITLKDTDYNLLLKKQLENLMGEDYTSDVNAAIEAVIGNYADVSDKDYDGWIDNVWGPITPRTKQPQEVGTDHGWPKYCTFYQNRLVFAGSKDKPMSVWCSVLNDLFNFDISEPDDDYALADTINSNTLNHITGVYAAKSLQVYTSGAEYVNDSKPMTPVQSNWAFQTGMGSKDNVALDTLDGSTLFVDRSGSIREFIYSYDQDNYVAKNLALLAPQIINSPKEMVILRSSQSDLTKLVYFLNEDGTMVVLNIDNNEKILAWTQWETDGFIEHITGVDQALYILVKRNGLYSLEVLGREEFSRNNTYSEDKNVFMDSFEVRAGTLVGDDSCSNSIGGPIGELWSLTGIWNTACRMFVDYRTLSDTTISGLDRFEGQYVQVLLDNFWQDNGDELGFLVTDGKIEVQRKFTTAKIGLGYVGNVKTLPISSPNSASQFNYNRVIKIAANFFESTGIELDGQYITDRDFGVYTLGQPPKLTSGLREVYTLGWDRLKQFNITSNYPYKFHLLSFTTVLDSNGIV